MIDSDRAWLILAKAFLRDAELDQLLHQFGSVQEIVSRDAATLKHAGLDSRRCNIIVQPDRGILDRELAWLERPNHHIVTRHSDDYPELLGQIADPPTLIYVAGSCDVLHLPALAIVGSRNPTSGGVSNARDFARCLGTAGFCIVSGLAQGIDTAAHRGSLDADAPTVAVLGHGMNRVYPRQNRRLAEEIVVNGAIISEYALGVAPRAYHFPQRNRLISGLSLGTVVVEAAKRSGSLITARLAAEQGREIFAIPGSIGNPMSRGCHQLIQQGARLVETVPDIVSELGPLVSHLMQNAELPLQHKDLHNFRDKDYKLLIDALGFDPVTIDELVENSGLTIEQVSSMLLILELQEEIELLNGGQYSRLRSKSRK
ncbi:MAG: DNA-processing protein DprA [Woeseiaceae bacterium]